MNVPAPDFFFADRSAQERRILGFSLLAAFVLEASLLTFFGWNSHWLAHPPGADQSTDNFVEAQIFELPPEAHLVEKSKPVAAAKAEATLSKVPHQGRKAAPSESVVQEQNQTEAGPPQAATHGPIAVFSPAPKIPAYLQDKELHTSVVIDFFVSAQGNTTPRLVGSSGNEELDAIALDAAKQWRFRPGEQEHKPVDSKVRLRIVFEVQ